MNIQQYRVELVKEKGVRYGEDVDVTNSEDVARLLETVYHAGSRAEENVWLICLNTKRRINGFFEVSRGSITSSFMCPSVIARNALLCNAEAVIVAHNHPSGDILPSTEDKTSTRRLKDALGVIGIELLDHIIIGGADYYSFRDSAEL